MYPTHEISPLKSAFSDKLAICSPQKKIPKQVSRQAVVNTVFAALFARQTTRSNLFDSDPGTDTDEPNEDFVKRGLELSLFRETGGEIARNLNRSESDVLQSYVGHKLIHTLVTEMRFEDFRTPSARIDILRAIHKNFPQERLNIAKALANATHLRLEYIQCSIESAYANCKDKEQLKVATRHDHGHGFTELLRFLIERTGERMNGFKGGEMDPKETDEVLQNYTRTLILLCRTHCLDPSGSDEDEIVDCAGQFVAYIPKVSLLLIRRLLGSWPTTFPMQQILYIRVVARVLMTARQLNCLDPQTTLHIRIFTRLAKCMQSSHVQLAQEASEFCSCPFVMNQYVVFFPQIYTLLSNAYHRNMKQHWNEHIRDVSEMNFDAILDYAP